MENTAKFKWLIEMEHKPIESYLQKLFFFAFALAEQKKIPQAFYFQVDNWDVSIMALLVSFHLFHFYLGFP